MFSSLIWPAYLDLISYFGGVNMQKVFFFLFIQTIAKSLPQCDYFEGAKIDSDIQ